jgi:hypothetical protein
VALVLLNVLLLPMLLASAVGLPFGVKLLLSGAVLVPLGFFMGMPFPIGLKRLMSSGNSGVEWAWAMNAAASVLGSVAAMIIAIHFGLSITLFCAGIAYVLAAACSAKLGLGSVAIREVARS